jgi:hypothetical protein
VTSRGSAEGDFVEKAARDGKCLFGTIGPLLEGVLAHKAVGEVYKTHGKLIQRLPRFSVFDGDITQPL